MTGQRRFKVPGWFTLSIRVEIIVTSFIRTQVETLQVRPQGSTSVHFSFAHFQPAHRIPAFNIAAGDGQANGWRLRYWVHEAEG